MKRLNTLNIRLTTPIRTLSTQDPAWILARQNCKKQRKNQLIGLLLEKCR